MKIWSNFTQDSIINQKVHKSDRKDKVQTTKDIQLATSLWRDLFKLKPDVYKSCCICLFKMGIFTKIYITKNMIHSI